eukprot:5768080-Alexandrium_andersonii.AAC.1
MGLAHRQQAYTACPVWSVLLLPSRPVELMYSATALARQQTCGGAADLENGSNSRQAAPRSASA